jgi:hypothetical protein
MSEMFRKERDRRIPSLIQSVRFSPVAGRLPVETNDKPKKSFEVINSYYKSMGEIDFSGPWSFELSSCVALRISRLILDTICEKEYKLSDNGGLSSGFYDDCLEKTIDSGLMESLDGDNDLVTISLKQAMHILRAAGLVRERDGIAVADDPGIQDRSLYCLILDSFWNAVRWEDIFPSNTDAAVILHDDRMIIRDLLLRYDERVDVNIIANEFFELTGFASSNDIYSISFLDFYLFFWLRNFSIIRYYDSRTAISIELTRIGKRLLSALGS